MPNYSDLRPVKDYTEKEFKQVFPFLDSVRKKRIISNLLDLRAGLENDIPDRKTNKSILIASWNISNFGHYTKRLTESYFYFAEIISRFDLVVVQEIQTTLHDLKIIAQLLGNDWEYMINDMTEGDDGNSERSAYLYNKNTVNFARVAGELVLWDTLTEHSSVKQLVRNPYLVGFQSGWKRFMLVNLHLHPGDEADEIALRKEEVTLLIEAIQKKKRRNRFWSENIILCGDFNFYKERDQEAIQAITGSGFKQIQSLKNKNTNEADTQQYDRFFLSEEHDYFRVGMDEHGNERGDVFNPFQYVFTSEKMDEYEDAMAHHYQGSKDITEEGFFDWYYHVYWRRDQLSDHLPIWFELIIDSSDEFLQDKLAELD
jgi:endonuclease/exonuclease/phosphatase family metal-dependent hydrolase